MTDSPEDDHDPCGCTADYCHICGPTNDLLNSATRPSSGHQYGPDFLRIYAAASPGDTPVDISEWTPLGHTTEGLAMSGGQGPDGPYADVTSYQTAGPTVSMEITDPEQVSRIAQVAFPDWTVGEALAFLHPAPPRRTLARWLRHLEKVGTRPLPQGGPPAATYRISEIMERHARWAKSYRNEKRQPG